MTADKSQMTGGAVRQTRSVWHCPQRRHQEESRKTERLGVDQARHLAGVGTSGDRQMGPGEQTLHGMFRGQRRPRALAVLAPAHVLALSCRRLPPAFRMAPWKGCAVTTGRGRVNVLFSGGGGTGCGRSLSCSLNIFSPLQFSQHTPIRVVITSKQKQKQKQALVRR